MSSIKQTCNIKSSNKEDNPQSKISRVTFCQVCGWYGYPFEKIIREFEGFRSEDEDGFAYKFTEYDYDVETGQKGTKHIHKSDPNVVQEAVEFVLKTRIGESCQE